MSAKPELREFECHTLFLLNSPWCYLYSLPQLGKYPARQRPGAEGTYGRVEPETGAYYIALTEGRDPKTGAHLVARDSELSLVYPERLFVWGEDEKGDGLSAEALLGHLKALNIPAHASYWEAVLRHTGYAYGGAAKFSRTLRADANLGVSWYSLSHKLQEKDLPKGWQMNVEKTQPGCWISIEI